MFSANLKRLRESRGLYQKDMAAKLGQKTNTYQNYELGKSEPSIAGLCKLADFFGVSIDELVGHATLQEHCTNETDYITKISTLSKLLGKEDQEKLCEIAKAFVALQNAAKTESEPAAQSKK